MTATNYTNVIDGEPVVTTEGMALLMGLDPEVIRAEARKQGVTEGQPLILRPEWIEAGQRTSARLQVEYGVTDMFSAIGLLAAEKARREAGR